MKAKRIVVPPPPPPPPEVVVEITLSVSEARALTAILGSITGLPECERIEPHNLQHSLQQQGLSPTMGLRGFTGRLWKILGEELDEDEE